MVFPFADFEDPKIFSAINDAGSASQAIEEPNTLNNFFVFEIIPEDYNVSISQWGRDGHRATHGLRPEDDSTPKIPNKSLPKSGNYAGKLATDQLQTRISKSTKRDRSRLESPIPGYMCFSTSGRSVKVPQRSRFSETRRQEVKLVRGKRACLRCSILKRTCSGEDPCKTCASVVAQALGARVLMWMECIRPSLRDLDVFQLASSSIKQAAMGVMAVELLHSTSIQLAVSHPTATLTYVTELELESRKAQYLLEPRNYLQFWYSTLEERLANNAWLLIVIMARFCAGYDWSQDDRYNADDIHILRNSVGHQVVSDLERLLKPAKLEGMKRDPAKARAMCHMILAVLLTLKLSQAPQGTSKNNTSTRSSDDQHEALCRLLCHYFAYLYQEVSQTPAKNILDDSLETYVDNSPGNQDVQDKFLAKLGFSIVPIY